MKVAWRKIGRIARRAVETFFLLEKSGVIDVIPDGKQGRIITGVNIGIDAVSSGVQAEDAKKMREWKP
jgi:hypothetical protein